MPSKMSFAENETRFHDCTPQFPPMARKNGFTHGFVSRTPCFFRDPGWLKKKERANGSFILVKSSFQLAGRLWRSVFLVTILRLLFPCSGFQAPLLSLPPAKTKTQPVRTKDTRSTARTQLSQPAMREGAPIVLSTPKLNGARPRGPPQL